MNIDDEKAALRAAAKKARTSAHAKHGPSADTAIATYGIGFSGASASAIVSAFLPIRNEIDPRPLMERLAKQSHPTSLPVMEGKNKPLVFRLWTPGEPLEETVWGIKEPPSSAPAVEPDVILVPLLAFDAHGYRIGYGGGFYDRSIEQLKTKKPIITIGLAFDEQRVDAVPHLDHDEQLDWMLTPSGPTRCNSA